MQPFQIPIATEATSGPWPVGPKKPIDPFLEMSTLSVCGSGAKLEQRGPKQAALSVPAGS